MNFRGLRSVVVAAAFAAIRVQAALDGGRHSTRGIHDYTFHGCGSSSLLEADFRKVASLNRDSVSSAVCGSICHELYIATVQGQCYCAEEISESIDTDSSECPDGVPIIFKDQKFDETPKKSSKDSSTSSNNISFPKLSGIHTDGDLNDDEPDPEHPDPEHPEPEHPGPEHPAPDCEYHDCEHPEPEHPGPEHHEPEHPGPEHHEPEHPEPGCEYHDCEHPGPDHHDPESPGPEYHEPEHPEPGCEYHDCEHPESKPDTDCEDLEPKYLTKTTTVTLGPAMSTASKGMTTSIIGLSAPEKVLERPSLPTTTQIDPETKSHQSVNEDLGFELHCSDAKHINPVHLGTCIGEEAIELCPACQKSGPNQFKNPSHANQDGTYVYETPGVSYEGQQHAHEVDNHGKEGTTKLETKNGSQSVSKFTAQPPATSPEPAAAGGGNATAPSDHQDTYAALGSRTMDTISIAAIIIGCALLM